MQHQQDREPDTRPRPRKPRRSVGELLAAWLLILWAVGWAGGVGPYFVDLIQGGFWGSSTILVNFLVLLQALLCFVAGLTTLLRSRIIAKWALFVACLCWIGITCVDVVIEPVEQPISPQRLLWSLGFLLAALLLFFLGWWLGRQEDSEA